MKKTAAVSICATVMLAAGTAHADVSPTAKIGYDTGGDTARTVATTDGDKTIKANEGFFVGAGFAVRNAAKTLETNVTINWKYTGIHASNGDVNFTRFPVDVLLFYTGQTFKVGAGVTYHLNPKIHGSGAGSGYSADYDDALGGMAEVDYRLGSAAIGVRYTSINYKVTGTSSSIKANGVGIVLSSVF